MCPHEGPHLVDVLCLELGADPCDEVLRGARHHAQVGADPQLGVMAGRLVHRQKGRSLSEGGKRA